MLTTPLASLTRADVALAGGKGANLGELVRAAFPVPDGFVLTTEAYELARSAAGVDPADPTGAAGRLRATPVPEAVAAAAREAYAALGGGAVAVRSSATAEDLAVASFAGQQDTYLDVEGEAALLDAIRRCWASLWNERAVAYRRANGIDDATVSLAVVVQKMVEAEAAGVLFTADPVAGTRRRASIDAVAGLGEALVSGRANPDHYELETRSGEIVARRLVGERAVLSDDELRALAAAGDRAERHFGAPQDIEFAIDGERRLWLVQSRPITTLYPLPPNAPDPETDLRVYFSANVAQGVFEPFTPMGLQTFRLLSASFARLVGAPLADETAGAPALAEAGLRLFFDVTPVVRDPVGVEIAVRVLGVMEARSARVVARLSSEPKLRSRGSRLRTIRRLLAVVLRTGAPPVVLGGLLRPEATRERVLREIDAELRRLAEIDPSSPAERVDAFQRLFVDTPRRLFPRLVGLAAPGFVSYNRALHLFRDVATADELRTVLRGLPHNPTTEMDLALWAIARDARDDPESLAAIRTLSPAELGTRYRSGTLPRWLQQHLERFLSRYGHRAIAEIDLGVPRWSEDPTHLLGAIANYQRLEDGAPAPDAQFARGAAEAERMVATLLGRVRGPRRVVARALLRRVRALAGLREQPKFQIMRLFAIGRSLLVPVGAELAAAGRVEAPDDIWFLTLPDVRRALAGEDLRATVEERRTAYRRELARRHVPRILLSDGTEPEATLPADATGALRGTPASPGAATAVARVIRSPQGARLEPGEILVAPSTDPGWTPLFLTAAGLVMEMGGMMSHGAVVAREYGIPAVVGVPEATVRIASGQRVTVDGSAGLVSLES